MKILIINYRFFISGGPERYMFNLIELLQSYGHEIIPFSIKYNMNQKSKYENYFASPLSNYDEIYFKEQTKNLKSIYKSIIRTFWSYEVYKKLNKLIEDISPDFAIVLHYQRKLSPSVLSALHKKKIPFIVRVSDFAMICPNGHLFREDKICEKCISFGLKNSVKYACVQNSKIASLINYLSLKLQYQFKIYNKIPFFIVPSKFSIKKHVEKGLLEKKFIQIPTFVLTENNKLDYIGRENLIYYIGRIEYNKGLHILIKSLKILKEKNVNIYAEIIGIGDNTYSDLQRSFCKSNELNNIKFLGFLDKNTIYEKLKYAKATIVPSLWYDNQPNSALESMACGTPVIASNHGSLSEIVYNGVNGYLFNPGDSEDLASKIENLINLENFEKLSKSTLNYVKEKHSPIKHYNMIMDLYQKIKRN
ncbi:MAG: hypothetical protein STSR0008_14130 [Ignavibacterium sp.]